MTKFFTGLNKAKKAAASVPPRELKEIQAAYGKLVAEAGQAQYLISVYKKDLERLNAELVGINQEAAQRQAIDRELAAIVKETPNE